MQLKKSMIAALLLAVVIVLPISCPEKVSANQTGIQSFAGIPLSASLASLESIITRLKDQIAQLKLLLAQKTAGTQTTPAVSPVTTQAIAPTTITANAVIGTGAIIAGWRSSDYGYQKQQVPAYWVWAANKMASKFNNATPGGVWVLGYLDDRAGACDCVLSWPQTQKNPKIYSDNKTDFNEPYLTAFDKAGMKIWLQVEPGNANVNTLIDLVMNRYKNHPSVMGFGIDVEWLNSCKGVAGGRQVTDAEAQEWLTRVKSYNPNYKLFLKHWETGKMPPTFRDKDLVFISDSLGYSSLSGLLGNSTDGFKVWGKKFSGSDTMYQYGYAEDKAWWSKLGDPAKEIGNSILTNISNTKGLFWVDFSITTAFPPTQAKTCSGECSLTGATKCSGTNVQVCGDSNNDGCLDWSAAKACTDGQTCADGKCGGEVIITCTPTTCASQGATCGTINDGCNGTLNCGTCAGGSACTNNKCAATCAPKTCSGLGYNCGAVSDGCNGTLSCGTCTQGNTCTNNKCVAGCTPKTCTGLGFGCGTTSNGCNGTLNCGTCTTGSTCTSNKCVANCVAKTCGGLGYSCGSASNGCNGTLNCGTCATGSTCTANKCVTNACVPKTCAGLQYGCGTASDGCTGTLNCGTCDAGSTCTNNSCVPTTVINPANSIITGWRSSDYGYQTQQPPSYWVWAANKMASKFNNAVPGGIWILGYLDDQGGACDCVLSWPQTKAYPNIYSDNTSDINEAYLTAFDKAGMKIWLQVESGNANMDNLIDLVMSRYKNHPSVIGFGVDVEWLNSCAGVAGGRQVTDAEAQEWLTRVKSYNPNYKLFLKHWETTKMPPTYRNKDLVLIIDSLGFSSMNNLINSTNSGDWSFKNWANAFAATSDTWYQFGYEEDKAWWSKYADPMKTVGDAVLTSIPNAKGLIWVDFSIATVFPPSQAKTCSGECALTGSTKCSGTNVQTCGDSNGDGCLDWSAATTCPLGRICANGKCGG